MKNLQQFIGVLFGLVIAGCSNDRDVDKTVSTSVTAPITISGKAIKGTITSGTGVFGSSGRSTFVTSNTDNTHKVLGDGRNTMNSNGTFSYSANNNKATITFDDSLLGKGNYHFTFTSKTAGIYTADAEQSPSAKQTGSFEVL